MNDKIEIYKGIRPGKIIERELEKRHINQRDFAAEIDEHCQTLNAVITGRRGITIGMALKIEQVLGYDEGFLSILQTYYDISNHKAKMLNVSVKGTPNIRKALFWDTDFDAIDWAKYKKFVIQRVLERGSKDEIKEVARFYSLNYDEMKSMKSEDKYKVHIQSHE